MNELAHGFIIKAGAEGAIKMEIFS